MPQNLDHILNRQYLTRDQLAERSEVYQLEQRQRDGRKHSRLQQLLWDIWELYPAGKESRPVRAKNFTHLYDPPQDGRYSRPTVTKARGLMGITSKRRNG